MARLKDTSKQRDDDAATQQLLTESHSPLADLPAPSAVLGANLLNAARINPPSFPEWKGKQGQGKLKRVSLKRDESSKQNLAVRGDPYEIELSPEKGKYALPEKVNHKPLKILKKKKKKGKAKSVDLSSDAPVASSELPVQTEGGLQVDPEELVEDLALPGDLVSAETDLRSSPPRLVPSQSDTVAVDNTRHETPPSVGERPSDALEHLANTRAVSKRKSESEHGDDRPAKCQREQGQTNAESVSSRKAHPRVRIPVRRRSQEQSTTEKVDHSNHEQGTQEIADDPVQEKGSRPKRAAPKLKSRRKPTNDTTVTSQPLPARKRGPQIHAKPSKKASKIANVIEIESASGSAQSDYESEREPDAERSESISDDGHKTVRPTGQPGSIETVFEFLNLKPRPGKCETKIATSIIHKCNVHRTHLQDSDIPTEQVAEDVNELQEMLRKINARVKEKDQRAFKGDAYGHVFRAVILYLEALYIWLDENDGAVTDSLGALRILSPLIRQILAFKDTIADWNVFVPKHFKGDRIIKDVDISLIAHLRHVDKTYRRCLSRLEATEQHRKQQAELDRKMKEQKEEEDRKTMSLEAQTQRWKRWQDLHIKRMLCETDPRRRLKLAIKKLEDLEEKDANGVVFERLPVFTSRSAPPHRQASTLDDSQEWTEQEETALLDGLKRYAGPQVFEKIFTTYCKPNSSRPLGGCLRERSVVEIVMKAAQFRSNLQKLYQDNGWVVEDWVTKIPVMPSKTVNELKILAKIHGVPDGAELRDIVAILMEKDRVNGVWPGMFDDPETEDTKGSRVAPVKQTLKKTETRSETNIATGGQSKSASVATVLNNNKVAETPTASMTATGSENDTAIPISQLRKEWDGLWGPPFAFSKVAPVDPKSQGTSIATAGSTPTRSNSPVSPVSSASSASLKSNRYEVLATEEKELVEQEELLTDAVEEDTPAAKMSIQSAPSVHGESLAIQTFSHQVDGEENVHLANENADVGEKTKKKGKRGKKGGRKVNKAKTDAAQSAATEIEKTEPSTSDAFISSKQAEDVPLPVSPAKVESTEGKVESTLEVSGPLPVVQENDGAIVEPSTSVAPTEIEEHIEEQTNADQFRLINVEDTEGSLLPIESPISEQSADSPPAAPSEPTVESSEKAPIHIFPVAPPVPLPSTETAQPPTPGKTKNQRRNEKRKENKQAATLSNIYDVLMSEQSADASTPDSPDKKEDENKDNSEGTAPAAKKKKRGTKGGKKAQAQKKHQPVSIVEIMATPIAETVAGPVVQTAVATKIQPIHLALGAVVAILAGAVGTWAII
ncbi:unnamed protein product [Alternaria alternata]